MDLDATLEAACTPDQLFAWVDDLSRYPSWLDIVPAAEAAAPVAADVGPAWLVTLRGRMGPLARSKRLRMVRTACDAPAHVRFERAEADGRDHAPWVLEASIASTGATSVLTMRLHYGGSLWVPLLDRLLSTSIETSRQRLLSLISDSG